MLAYENEMFLTAMQEDGLTIAAKGLGLEQVFLSLVRVHCDPGNLVLVLGCLVLSRWCEPGAANFPLHHCFFLLRAYRVSLG